MSSLEELRTKIETYEAKLATVEASLDENSDGEVLLKLKHDVESVLKLTRDLYALKKSKETVDDTEFETGQRVYAKYTDGEWYIAQVGRISTAVEDGKPLYLYTVTYLEYGNTHRIKSQDMRLLHPPSLQDFVVGKRCKALYSDGLCYPGEIKRVLDDGFEVQFDDADTLTVAAKDVFREDESVPEESDSPVEELVIPPYLRLKPGDSEHQKAVKRSKVKRLKQEHKRKVEEKEQLEKQQSWQAFQSGSGAERALGFRSSTRNKSIFSSSRPQRPLFRPKSEQRRKRPPT